MNELYVYMLFLLFFLMLLTLCKGIQWSASCHTIELTRAITTILKNQNSSSTFDSCDSIIEHRLDRQADMYSDHWFSWERKKTNNDYIYNDKTETVLFRLDRYIGLLEWTAIYLYLHFFHLEGKRKGKSAIILFHFLTFQLV